MIVHRTKFVSFPRSGHHWLMELLKEALGPAFQYSEYYRNGLTLENTPGLNAQKDHDFNLTLPKDPQYRYVVQYRAFVPAAISWWKMSRTEDAPIEDFYKWLQEKHRFWNAWYDKWGPHNRLYFENHSALFVDYEQLYRNPVPELDRVIQFITDAQGDQSYYRAVGALLLRPPKRHDWNLGSDRVAQETPRRLYEPS